MKRISICAYAPGILSMLSINAKRPMPVASGSLALERIQKQIASAATVGTPPSPGEPNGNARCKCDSDFTILSGALQLERNGAKKGDSGCTR
jgi:hypothetical protein